MEAARIRINTSRVKIRCKIPERKSRPTTNRDDVTLWRHSSPAVAHSHRNHSPLEGESQKPSRSLSLPMGPAKADAEGGFNRSQLAPLCRSRNGRIWAIINSVSYVVVGWRTVQGDAQDLGGFFLDLEDRVRLFQSSSQTGDLLAQLLVLDGDLVTTTPLGSPRPG